MIARPSYQPLHLWPEPLHVYAGLVASGAQAEQRYPGLAAHLRACGPCGEDFEALLSAVRDPED